MGGHLLPHAGYRSWEAARVASQAPDPMTSSLFGSETDDSPRLHNASASLPHFGSGGDEDDAMGEKEEAEQKEKQEKKTKEKKHKEGGVDGDVDADDDDGEQKKHHHRRRIDEGMDISQCVYNASGSPPLFVSGDDREALEFRLFGDIDADANIETDLDVHTLRLLEIGERWAAQRDASSSGLSGRR